MRQVIQNYELSVLDEWNYVVRRLRGLSKPKFVGYYHSIEAAINEIARRLANDEPDLRSWIKKYRELQVEIEELVT